MSYNDILKKENLAIIEIGNSRLKFEFAESSLFFDYTKLNSTYNENELLEFLNNIFTQNSFSKIYYSSVNPAVESFIYKNFDVKNINNFISKVSGMGIDRKLGLIAASEIYGKDALTIDFGTAQTYNLLVNNVCEGGYITAGLFTRINGLLANTNIPKFDVSELAFSDDVGLNSKDAIVNGAFVGLLAELKQILSNTLSQYPALKIVATGGLSSYFFNSLIKNDFSLILHQNLVNEGIKVILSKIYDK